MSIIIGADGNKLAPSKKPVLAIVQYLKKYGVDHAIDNLHLKVREYPHCIHLKYNQIESDMSLPEVQECRGLVLAKTSEFQVLSYPFRKFFNYGEGLADKIDWTRAKILEKRDGTMIHFYYNFISQRWCVGTSGTAQGEGEVTNANTGAPITFKDLFYRCLEEQVMRGNGMAKDVLNKQGMEQYINSNYRPGLTYVFELTSPHNTIVTPHKINELRLLTVRNLIEESADYLQEANDMIMDTISDTIGIPLVSLIFRGWETNLDKLINNLRDMPFTEEGYVVVDDKHRRIKIKNPTYIEAHFLKHKQKRHQIIKVVKQNEIDEFVVAFPERLELLTYLKQEYDNLANKMDSEFQGIQDVFEMTEGVGQFHNKKDFAMQAIKTTLPPLVRGFLFSKYDDKVSNAAEYLSNMDDKKLYLHLIADYVPTKEDW